MGSAVFTGNGPRYSGGAPGDPAHVEVEASLALGARFARSGHPEAALRELRGALARATTAAHRAEGERLLAFVHRSRGEWDDAIAAAGRSAAHAADAGRADLEVEGINAQGSVHLARGDWQSARPLYARGLTLAPDARARGKLQQNLGTCAALAGEVDEARAHFAAALEAFGEAGHESGMLVALNNLAQLHIDFGDPAAALPLLTDAAALARKLMELDSLLVTTCNEAEALGKLGRLTEAEDRVGEAIGFFLNSGNDVRRADCIRVLGDVHAAHGTADHDETALRCYAHARRLYEQAGAPHYITRVDAAEERLAESQRAGGPRALQLREPR